MQSAKWPASRSHLTHLVGEMSSFAKRLRRTALASAVFGEGWWTLLGSNQ